MLAIQYLLANAQGQFDSQSFPLRHDSMQRAFRIHFLAFKRDPLRFEAMVDLVSYRMGVKRFSFIVVARANSVAVSPSLVIRPPIPHALLATKDDLLRFLPACYSNRRFPTSDLKSPEKPKTKPPLCCPRSLARAYFFLLRNSLLVSGLSDGRAEEQKIVTFS